jgi:hypothetical protein
MLNGILERQLAKVVSASHADRCDSFNIQYKDVLQAKRPEKYTGHVIQAKLAHSSAKNYRECRAEHEMNMV